MKNGYVARPAPRFRLPEIPPELRYRVVSSPPGRLIARLWAWRWYILEAAALFVFGRYFLPTVIQYPAFWGAVGKYGAIVALFAAVLAWGNRWTFVHYYTAATVAATMTWLILFFGSAWRYTTAALVFFFLGSITFFAPQVGLPIFIFSTYLEWYGGLFAAGGTAVTMAKFFGGVLIIAVVAHALAKRQKLNLTKADIPAFAFLVVHAASVFVAVDQATALKSLQNYAFIFMVYCIIRTTASTRKPLRWALWALVLGGALSSGMALERTIFTGGNPMISQSGRAVGFSFDANMTAMLAILGIPIALALMEGERSNLKKAFLYALIAILAGAPIVTASRGGFLALIISFLYMNFSRRRLSPGTLVATGLAVAGLIVALQFAPQQITERMTHIGLKQTMQGTEEADTSARLRIYALESAGGMVRDHPILGIGSGCFGIAWGEYGMPWGHTVMGRYGLPRPSHIIFVDAISETGIVGLGILVWVLVTVFRSVWRAKAKFVQLRDASMARMVDAMRAMLIILVVLGFMYSLEQVRTFWMVMAFGLCLEDVARKIAARQDE
jgi:O-antigen ligase